MKKSILFIFIGVMAISFTAMSAQSPNRGPFCFRDNYALRLNLSVEQYNQLEKLHQDFIKDINPIQDRLTCLAMEIRKSRYKSLSNSKVFIQMKKEFSVLEQKFQEKILDYRLDALAVLTTEQILLLPPDCCLGIHPGRGFGRGCGFGWRGESGIGRGYGRGHGMGNYHGRGRRGGMRYGTGFRPFWRR
jgi:hypothetical protein